MPTPGERVYKKYAQSLYDVKRKHGSDALSKAQEIVNEFASEDVKGVLRSKLGDDPETIERVLDYGAQAERTRDRETQNQNESAAGILYGGSMNSAHSKRLERDLSDGFNNMINIEAKSAFIRRAGDPEND